MKICNILALGAGALILAGCTAWKGPSTEVYPESSQLRTQAAHHWDLLAEQQAAKILAALPDKADPIYVEGPTLGQNTFSAIYQDLLVSQLVGKGGVVVTAPNLAMVQVSYTVRPLVHQEGGDDYPGYGPMPGSTWTMHPPTEIVITNTVRKGHYVLLSNSEVFYFHRGEKWIYMASGMPAKNYALTDH
ncbi:MAG: hypothetical protein WCP34_02550 [Pseudomonadota bacterium]